MRICSYDINMLKILAVAVLLAFVLVVILIADPLSIMTADKTQWNQQTIDTGGSFGPIILSIDSQNNPHVLYNGENGMMFYASWDRQKWNRQNIIQGAIPEHLVLDSQNNPHILYESQSGATYYSNWNGQNWTFESVPSGLNYALALDSTDIPCIAYTQQLPVSEYPQGVTNNIAKLNYATWTDSEWVIQEIDSPVSHTDDIYLAFYAQNIPCIMFGYDTYYPPSGGYTQTVKFAVYKESNWTVQNALSNLDAYSNLVLNSNGQVHFSYTIQHPHESTVNTTIGYATWDSTTTQTELVVSNIASQMATKIELAIDNKNNPHIEFFNGSLMYASRIDSCWNIQTVAPDNYAYGIGPLKIDSNGNPYICYWVVDIRNTKSFVSKLLITSTLPLDTTELPLTTPTTVAPTSVSQIWTFNPVYSQIISPQLIDGYLYFLSGNSGGGPIAMYCLNSATGTQIWNKTAQSNGFAFFEDYLISEGRLYLGGALSGNVCCIDSRTGAVLWNYSSGGTGFGSLITANGVLYAAGNNYRYSSGGSTDNGILVALDSLTGTAYWRFNAPSQTRFGNINHLVKDGVVYVASAFLSDVDSSWHSEVFALHASTGKVLWSFKAPSYFNGITLDNKLLYIQSSFADTTNYINLKNVNGRIYQGGVVALNTTDGTKVWEYATDDTINSLSTSNSTVYAVSDDGNVYSFDSMNGRIFWDYNAGTNLGNLIETSNYLYVGSSSGVYCLDKSNGRIIWNFAEPSFTRSSSTNPTLSSDIIYVGWNGPTSFAPNIHHNLYALDAVSGQKIWNFTLPNVISNAPIFENGTIYVAGDSVSTRSQTYLGPAAFYALKPDISNLITPNN